MTRVLAVFGTSVGWAVLNAVWHTALVALGYALWRRHTRAHVRWRHDVAALGLLCAAAVTLLDLAAPFAADKRPRAPSGAPVAAPVFAPTSSARPNPAPPAVAPLTAALVRSDVLVPLACLWGVGVAWLVARLIAGWLIIARWRTRARPLTSGPLVERLHALQARAGITTPVALLDSPDVAAPATAGWRRPAILLPAHMVRSACEQVEPLLAHELAHVKHRDYAANLVQSLIDAVLCLSPGARWLSAEVRRLREYRCDDMAVALCGERTAYVRALGELARWGASGSPLPAPGAAGPRLVDRIRRLMEGETMARPTRTYTIACLSSIALTAGVGLALPSWSSVSAASKQPVAVAPHEARAALGSFAFALPWENTERFQCNSVRLGDVDWSPFGTSSRNEFEPQYTREKLFYCNPVRLDGAQVDWTRFGTKSRGILTMVYGHPDAADATAIRFRISLRREGKIVSEPGSPLDHDVASVDLSQIMPLAHDGDQLILNPTNLEDWRAKRIFNLGGC